MQGEAAVGLEHVVQEGGTQLRKVARVQVVLQPVDKETCTAYSCWGDLVNGKFSSMGRRGLRGSID